MKTRTKPKKKSYTLHIFLFIILILLLITTIIFLVKSYQTTDDTYDPIIISHRGAAGEEMEHTFESYDLAILYGSEYIEQDIVLSKDGTPYVSHDTNSARLTGVNKEYNQMHDNEIKTLKLEGGEPILTLEEVFNKYKDSTKYVIELKTKEQSKTVANIIKKHQLEEHVIIQSYYLNEIKEFHKLLPDTPLMFLADSDSAEDYQKALKTKEVTIICLNKKMMTADVINEIHAQHKQAFFYTVDSMKDINRAYNLRADGFFTGYTAKALKLLENRQ